MQKNRVIRLVLGLSLLVSIAFVGSVQAGSHGAKPMEMIIEVSSPLGFDETVEKLKSNAKALGWKVPKKWAKNFQKNLKHVTKIDIGRNLVVEMCEPWAAAKLLVHDEYKKLLPMMPCSVAVYEKSDGKVYISMINMRVMSQMFKGKEIKDMVEELAPEMEQMLKMK